MDTERMIIDLDKICRACMTEGADMLSVFNKTETEDIRIVDMLESCSSLNIEAGDGLPTQICLTCYGLINTSYNFRRQCQKSDSIMRSYLREDNDNIRIVKMEDVLNSCNNEFIANEITEDDFTHFEEVTTEVGELDDEKMTELDYEVNLSYNCKNCNQIFMTPEALDAHHEGCETRCPKCFKKFKYQDSLQLHFTHCVNHECPLCNKKFRTSGFLQNHMKRHNPAVDKNMPGEKRFKCNECDKAYTSPANLTIHQYSHSGIKPYKCHYCGKGFTKSVALNSHMAIHTGNRSHLCSECGRGFTSASILNQHKKIHTGEKPYKCEECGKGFTASGDLTIHIRSHTGEKPYLCPTCGRAFARITHLNTHIRTHTGERPYLCKECGKGFAQSGDLRSHVRTHTGERPYVCAICKKSFIQSSGLSSHMATHSTVKSHVCTVCNRAFSQASSLARHLKGHT